MSELERARLDSWKAIAVYLGRDLRTVRRWEREKGLPVHRVPGGERRSVFAYPDEINKWLQNGKAGLPGANEVTQESQLAPQIKIETLPFSDGVLRKKPSRRVILISAVLLAIACGFATIRLHDRGGELSKVIFRDNTVQALDESSVGNGTVAPVVTFVTSILPLPEEGFVIIGRGFGIHTAYTNQDTPYLAIRDKTARWAAGRIIATNWDEVTLSVASWTDSEIVVTGFSGAYGTQGWKLSVGDEIEIAVWNPQTHAGPGTYRLHVSAESAP